MNVVAQLKDNALSMNQLKALVGSVNADNAKWLVWNDLAKFQNYHDLMDKGAVVILLQIERPDAPKVGHFILLLDFGDHLEHFDSYGLTMEQELDITAEPHFTRIFKV